jgi:ABC transporter with metal-binding/Fe-S-binding domain ATP-binding protein
MKLGVLFSGGKDSTLAMMKAMKEHEVVCLVTLVSENPASYMFHTANIHVTEMQAEAIGLPLLVAKTKGEKEIELDDLKNAIAEAQDKYGIEGIVTGALKSVYQASRIQKICDELGLVCYNPLWQMDQVELLNEVVASGMKVIISGVFAEPLGKELLGKFIDEKMIEKLKKAAETHKINPAGEGGEIETTVLDCTIFKKKIAIKKSSIEYKDFAGIYKIEDAVLEPK